MKVINVLLLVLFCKLIFAQEVTFEGIETNCCISSKWQKSD